MKRLVALAAFAAIACARAGEPGPAPLRVVTLHTVLTEIASEVGGGEVRVTGLLKPGVDPHTFNPSPEDIRSVVDADLVLASGLNLEAYLDRLVTNVGPRGRVVRLGDDLPASLEMPAGPSREADPHWWNSVAATTAIVDKVRIELTRERPASAAVFDRNARAYVGRLADLEAWARKELEPLPPERRQLVTSHDAFGYFAREFGFEVHPIGGVSTEGEVDARRLVGLVDLVNRDHIRAIFTEGGANPRVVRRLVEETGVRLGGMLYDDGLGPAGSGAETYDAMFRHNVRTIVDALAGP